MVERIPGYFLALCWFRGSGTYKFYIGKEKQEDNSYIWIFKPTVSAINHGIMNDNC